MHILDELEARGLLNQVTDREGLEKELTENRIALYSGFDPTADSLHIGHLLPVLALRRFQLAGHTPIALVGGATGLIGDPSGRSDERTLNSEDIVKEWTNKLQGQLARFLDFGDQANSAKAVNNFDWIGELNVIPFLRDVGKNFGLNYMLAKDSVTSRLEAGISFTEFTYMILQSYDFLQLYRQENCRLQIGGSDQWGNITAGLELIRKEEGTDESTKAFGATFPLVTKSDGSKFGKSEGGAIWLDADKTSPYEFYQFWINADDRDVVKFLNYFTFLTIEEIKDIESKHEEAPEKREAHRKLAEEVTKLVHGEEKLQQAINISEALFSGDIKQLTAEEIRLGFKDVPSYHVEDREKGLIDLLVEAGISPSKRQAREDIKNGAVYINGERCQEMDKVISETDQIENQYVIIRRGKKKYFLLTY
ncbi:tyrosine--tRNA ligase [Guptibacillus hwajinpoensis]|uniref:Tyrosine--tRNA ligase n=1 Tax=Guptibacillus hwajinpoensis TaxID=208199 RepID=A0ABU0JVY6_9BACL|nr:MULTISPECIES: tyrosine--tRNA ligase [Alkalihalobacillus]MDP4550952.1 tyrosine--tRNA ligase [Alkalihalobacillus macyae]MDQ0481266.1 tyrosyl-tRNA synthetase [Alkalihalobacillus hemicentroti]